MSVSSNDSSSPSVEPVTPEQSEQRDRPNLSDVTELKALSSADHRIPESLPRRRKPPEVSYSGKAYRWNREKYSRQRRFIDIWAFVLKLMGARWLYTKSWSYRGGVSDAKKAARRQALAIWIRETLLDLGPTFIKIGQLFSTRADLFAAEFVEELSKLQDRVPAFSYEQVATIIQQDLGKSIEELYRSFDPIPLAAASLGQVHRAQLHSGEEVVVKVQRPGLRKLFEIDLQILKGITRYFQNHPEWGKGRDWLGIYEECCKILWEEVDYLNEGRNADSFRRNFRGEDWVHVPRVYWRYASPRVLTLEYMPGIKISHYDALEAAGLDRKELAQLGAKAYLHQLLNDGFFHADPHPGNIAVNPDGGLIFYDFGMMGQIKPVTREKLLDTFFGIAQKDGDRVVKSLIELGALSPADDMGPIRRSVQFMLDHFMDKPFEEQSVGAISDDLYEIAYDQPFRFPATFTFVMRAFSTLEGVGKGLDPDFNFMEVAKPFAMQLMTNGNSPDGGLLNELSRQAAQVGTTAFGLPRRIEDTLDKLERGDIRVRVRSTETDRILRRISGVNMGTNYTLLASAFTVSATILLVNHLYWIAGIVAVAAVVSGIALIRLMMKLDRFDRMP
ncbi:MULTISPECIES: ABC1 kinase family protein [Leptolyngbya]|uniref:ABC transporter n=1 Tax=Leptolyngbya boryana NIES-2135 TaxID=1973484 RepID=A0A1Z4JFF3_LEPBY|nr:MULTISPECIES: AarF/ABC1/UbiB kinase family protein [Leptolyngbya]BAY55505.1 ABC transporter [Leptolyngbya boryana NIES-2135]MBN8562246.1 AarF/ABC1/UbiB kinase family protein [Leptolyngbya sp. UWPOB_LEPTO1]MCY6492512.1 AarF/ABC1/UbiB kinase family protein [Leptolyngbya sp. GGD]ULP32400.1 AarF/ABC1/UbiB kinase family protein [Leptolyngbya boryana IU 594]BAS58284.1 putative unusual protein kinase [Leptolyngbya boryana IAM M-101]